MNKPQPEEIKNGVMGSWSAAATSLGLFTQISYEQLVVGHTHEDIGSLAALVGRSSYCCHCLLLIVTSSCSAFAEMPSLDYYANS